ncbi:MAG TPA: imidazoleglycerol-phosphate dehydratase HisB [Clostridiales bacterium]|nr:imidazoleglycerol-phosphate dehydratase HisB [Clostridiales bacterium]
MARKTELSRKTAETDIRLKLDVDGSGAYVTETGIGFFDHMLALLSKHSLMDLEIRAEGDLDVDAHHTVEDIGIVFGQALKQALGSKESIRRYGSASVPMDEALAMVNVDLGGRPFLVFNVKFSGESVGNIETGLIEEFFRAVSSNACMNIHINVPYGSSNHHICEAIFKAFGRALDEATRTDDRIKGVMSTKGVL